MAAKGSGEPPPRKALSLVLRIHLYKFAVAASAATTTNISLFFKWKNDLHRDKRLASIQIMH